MASKPKTRRRRSPAAAAAAPTQSPPAQSQSDGRGMTLVKQAATVVGLISSVVALGVVVYHFVRPHHQPTPDRSAAISGVVVNQRTTHGQFLDYSDQSKLGFTKAQLAVMGASAFARVQITGYRGKPLTIERQLVDARTGNVIGQARDFTVTPTANSNTHRWWDWVPLRAGRGSYLMVIKVIDPTEHAAVACGQTTSFGGLKGALPVTSPPQLCEREGS